MVVSRHLASRQAVAVSTSRRPTAAIAVSAVATVRVLARTVGQRELWEELKQDEIEEEEDEVYVAGGTAEWVEGCIESLGWVWAEDEGQKTRCCATWLVRVDK
ncbi:hypothetical protein C0991_008723 [Blastosporella zonata]|nr:hypothetical protein C0991_008723 [Blastosporella zonata]